MAVAGEDYTVLLQNDGKVIAVGSNDDKQCEIPDAQGDTTYTQVSAGSCHTVLLQSDGKVIAVGGQKWQAEGNSLFFLSSEFSTVGEVDGEAGTRQVVDSVDGREHGVTVEHFHFV